MHHELKMFNTGQITLPKKWRSRFPTNRFVAEESENALVIRPLFAPDEKNRDIVVTIAQTLSPEEWKLLRIRIPKDNEDPGVVYETESGQGVFFPNGISPQELLEMLKTEGGAK